MKRIAFIFSAVLVVAIAACSKDQKAVNTVEGTWETQKEDGVEIPDSNKWTYTFTKCKLKSDEWCDASYTDDGDTDNFTYNVSGDGTIMTWRQDDGQGGSFDIPMNIDELTKDKMVLSINLFGSSSTLELAKQ